jgi:putative tryptophan/tyrosine transport system substrate-binding protein
LTIYDIDRVGIRGAANPDLILAIAVCCEAVSGRGKKMQFDVMNRRKFITLGSLAAAWPAAARAQPKQKLPTIGYLSPGFGVEAEPVLIAFRQGLLDIGYVDGENAKIEFQWANARYEQLPALAANLVRQQVAVIFASSPVAAIAAKNATTTLPIVFGLGSDPVRNGLVTSLNRPGGNITGATFFGNLLSEKRLELFQRLVPDSNVIAMFINPENANVQLERNDMQEAARHFGLRLVMIQASSEHEIDKAVIGGIQQDATALVVSGDALFLYQRKRIAELSARYKIPVCCPYRDQAIAGCLMSYGADIQETYRQAGNYVGRILKGEKPADLPVLQPTKFELVLNLKTAKTIGLAVPDSFLSLADEVIE